MTSQPIQNLFDAVEKRQIRSIPFMNAVRTGRESKTRGKIDDAPTVNKIVAAMTKGVPMNNTAIARRSGLKAPTVTKALERYPYQFKKVGRGLWVRL